MPNPDITDTQVRVLAAVNDHCESIGTLYLDQDKPLPDLLRDLQLVDAEVYTGPGRSARSGPHSGH